MPVVNLRVKTQTIGQTSDDGRISVLGPASWPSPVANPRIRGPFAMRSASFQGKTEYPPPPLQYSRPLAHAPNPCLPEHRPAAPRSPRLNPQPRANRMSKTFQDHRSRSRPKLQPAEPTAKSPAPKSFAHRGPSMTCRHRPCARIDRPLK